MSGPVQTINSHRQLRFPAAAEIVGGCEGSVWPSGAEHELQCPLKCLLVLVIKYLTVVA